MIGPSALLCSGSGLPAGLCQTSLHRDQDSADQGKWGGCGGGTSTCLPRLVVFSPDCLLTRGSPHSGRSGGAGGRQVSGPAQSAAPEEDGRSGSGPSGAAVRVAGSAVHRGGSEGALQTRPPQHAGLGQEEEARPTGWRPDFCPLLLADTLLNVTLPDCSWSNRRPRGRPPASASRPLRRPARSTPAPAPSGVSSR